MRNLSGPVHPTWFTNTPSFSRFPLHFLKRSATSVLKNTIYILQELFHTNNVIQIDVKAKTKLRTIERRFSINLLIFLRVLGPKNYIRFLKANTHLLKLRGVDIID